MMQPYRRIKKPLRRSEIPRFGKWFWKASKATGSILLDLQSVWYREPPFPASVRIVLTLCLLSILLMPLLYLMVPPIFTILTIQIIKGDDINDLFKLPDLSRRRRKTVFRILKVLLRKLTFRLSMLVTFYDYIQTFRAMGIFNLR